MKKISIILSVCLIIQIMAFPAYAQEEIEESANIIYSDINEEAQTYTEVVEYGTSVFYTYVDDEISYCAQISDNGNIIFSYVLANESKIYESTVSNVDELYSNYVFLSEQDTSYYSTLNSLIMDDLDSFDTTVYSCNSVSSEIIAPDVDLMASNTLSSAVTAVYGTDYVNVVKGMANKTYNGTIYSVFCKEAQATTCTSPESNYFLKDTAITSIVSWVIAGAWTWKAAVATLVLSVVSTVVVNGITYVKNSFTAQRASATVDVAQTVTVSGYTGIHYWAGWSRRRNFLKGDLGWTYDIAEYYTYQHDDFGDIQGLINSGFNSFVSNVL